MKKTTSMLSFLAAGLGTFSPPTGVASVETGLPTLVGNILKTLIVIAGVYAVFNFVLAGYAFMSAGDDPKKVQGALQKIWQTLIGLIFAAGAFVIAALAGQLIFKDANALLQIKIFGL